MSSGDSVIEALRIRYSYVRIQWLALAVAGMAILTFSAQELWGGNTQGLSYVLNPNVFYIFATIFSALILLVNIIDFRRVSESNIVAVFCACISVLLDFGILFFSEFLVLLTINQLALDLRQSLNSISLLVFPWLLGEIALSSLTVEHIRKRAEKLLKEAEELRKEVESLEKQRRKGEEDLKEFEKKRREFQKTIKSDEKSGEEE